MKLKQQNIAKGFAILSLANIGVKMLSLLYTPVMRNLFGDGYGIFGAVSEVFAFIYVIATAGLPVAISKLVSELTSLGNKKAAAQSFKLVRFIMIILGLFISIIIIAFAVPIASFMGIREYWQGISILAPTVFVCTILSAYRGYFQGKRNMTPTAQSQIFEQIVNVGLSITLVIVLGRFGVVWAVVGSMLGTTFGALTALLIMLINYRKYKDNFDSGDIGLTADYANCKEMGTAGNSQKYTKNQIIKKIFSYSIPITLSSGVQYGGNLLDKYLLDWRLKHVGFTYGEITKMYGNLYSARQLINVPNSMITSLCITVLPAVAAAYALRNRRATSARADYGFKLCFLLAFPLASAMTAFSDQIFRLLHFGSAYGYLMALSFSLLLIGTMQVQSACLQGVNRLFTSTVFITISLVLKTIFNYILIGIPQINIYGAIISTYISVVIPVILNHLVLTRVKKLKIDLLGNAWRPALCSIVMLAFSMGVYQIFYRLMTWMAKGSLGYLINAVAFIIAA
ncbi:MAG: polysaccharide biosynthesis protein, partial [Clostridiales bacterium]|nr:polysaccharide biosynthesis protein [Clostridiales bacterium]